MKAPDMAETVREILSCATRALEWNEKEAVALLASYTEEVVKALAQESGWPFSVEAAARKLGLIK